LSEAGRLSSALGGCVKALFIGEGISSAVSETGTYGVKEAYVADAAGLKDYSVEKYTAVIADAAKKSGATVILATASALGRDLMPRVAARLNTGMVTECVQISAQGGKIVAKRPAYAGKCFVDVTVTSTPAVITCRPNVFEITPSKTPTTPMVTKVGADAASLATKAKISEVLAVKSDKPDLTEAAIIVAAGRAIKSAENFKIMQDLADVVGAAVGASRAAVDAGYAEHSIQIGQTGKTVNPKLYFAFGISGAIQHLAGMQTSKVIVAVNTDAEAPIFQKATYGIVGDLFQVAPLLTEELRKRLKE
jgi:electron transfer flavoprotein alpha subunit